MKRAIVKRFIVVLIVAMAISSIVISMSYYRLASHRVMEDMKPVLLLLDATNLTGRAAIWKNRLLKSAVR